LLVQTLSFCDNWDRLDTIARANPDGNKTPSQKVAGSAWHPLALAVHIKYHLRVALAALADIASA